MDWNLNTNEARVLGALIEKAISTPDYYPLSLNALVNACNQKSNRDPFLTLDEDVVRQAVHTLGNKGLAAGAPSSGRVAKYEHRMQEVFNLGRREEAILCVLLLRGPQTPGELRGRTDRLFPFEDLADVESTLERLMQRDPSLVKALPRQPGMKEARYIHLLSLEVAWLDQPGTPPPSADRAEASMSPTLQDDLAGLRQELKELRHEVAQLTAQVLALGDGKQPG